MHYKEYCNEHDLLVRQCKCPGGEKRYVPCPDHLKEDHAAKLEHETPTQPALLESLEHFNERRRTLWDQFNPSKESIKNGLACPDCGDELYDTDPTITLTSATPQKYVHCDCGFRGTRIK